MILNKSKAQIFHIRRMSAFGSGWVDHVLPTFFDRRDLGRKFTIDEHDIYCELAPAGEVERFSIEATRLLGRRRPRNTVVTSATIVLGQSEWTHLTLYHESNKTVRDLVNKTVGVDRIFTSEGHSHQVYFAQSVEIEAKLAEALARPDKVILVRSGGEASPKVGLNLNEGQCGVPYWVIRDLFKMRETLKEEDVPRLLGLPETESKGVFKAMLNDELLEPGSHGEYVQTPRGKSLAAASFMRRLPRAKAEKLLTEVINRAEKINLDPDLTYYVESLHLFGSLLDGNSPDVGDVDLRLSLRARPGIGSTTAASVERSRASGRDHDFFASLNYGTLEVYRLLKNRSSYVSLHTPDDVDQLGCVSKLVFEGREVAHAAKTYDKRD